MYNTLKHYGIKGQQKGIRRFQYANNTYTPEGNKRYRPPKGNTTSWAKKTTAAALIGEAGIVGAKMNIYPTIKNIANTAISSINTAIINSGSSVISKMWNSVPGYAKILSIPVAAVYGTHAALNIYDHRHEIKKALQKVKDKSLIIAKNNVMPIGVGAALSAIQGTPIPLASAAVVSLVTTFADKELYHHGIKGQRWGKRNGPPYPLDYEDHSASEKKAGWEMSVKSVSGTKGTVFKDPAVFANAMDNNIYSTTAMERPDGTIYYPPIASFIKDELAKGYNPFPNEMGFEGAYDRVNPGYDTGIACEPGRKNNCTMCGAVTELQGMGYDVTARPSYGGASAGIFTRWFKGAKNEMCDTMDELYNDILNDGDGSSGVMQGFYGDGFGSGSGGHTIHWRNEKGNVIISDGQIHKEMSWDEMTNYYGFNKNKCIRTRLDNTEPNWDTLAEDGVIGIPISASKKGAVTKYASERSGKIYDRL